MLPLQLITVTINQNFTNLQRYTIYFSQIINPPACITVDSFKIRFIGGLFTGIKTAKLLREYLPGSIYSASLNSLSGKKTIAGAIDTYIFKFMISHTIPIGGYIAITFPSQNWDKLPLTYNTSVVVTLYSTPVKVYRIQPVHNQPLTLLLEGVFTSPLYPNPAGYITVQVNNIQNPNKNQQTSTFMIQTFDSGMNVIDELTDQLTLQIQNPGVISLQAFSSSTQEVDAVNQFYFGLSTTSFYYTGGYIEINVPFPFITFTQVTCYPLYGFLNNNYCTPYANNNTIRFGIDLDVITNTQIFALFKLVNPLAAAQIPSFQIFYRNKNDDIVAQISTSLNFSTVPGNCKVTGSGIDLKNSAVGFTGASYFLGFQCDHRIRNKGKITILIPVTQMQYNSEMRCKSNGLQVDVYLYCSNQLVRNGQYINITINQWISGDIRDVAPNQVLGVLFENVKNPPYMIPKQNLASIEIYTLNNLTDRIQDYYVVDQITNGVYFTGSLTPGPISDFTVQYSSVSKTDQNLAGGLVQYNFNFTTYSALPQLSSFTIYFPARTAYTYINYKYTCFQNIMGKKKISQVQTACSIYSINNEIISIQFTSLCTSQNGCSANSLLNLTLQGVSNPTSIHINDNTTFTIVSNTQEGYQVDQGSFQAEKLSFQPGFLTASLLSPLKGNIIVGAITTYTFQIQNNYNPIYYSDGSIVIQFPSEVQIQNNQPNCTAMTNLFLLNCQVQNQKLIVTSTQDIDKGSTIMVTIANSVQNPQVGQQSSSFVIQSFQGSYLIDSMTDSLVITPDVPNDVVKVKLSRDHTFVDLNFKLGICFQTTNYIPQNTEIDIYIPSDAIQAKSLYAEATTQTSFLIVNTVILNKVKYFQFTLKEWCSSTDSCYPLTEQCTEVTGFSNPATVNIPQQSAIINVLTSSPERYRIDSSANGLYIQPFIRDGDSLIINAFQRVNDIVGLTPVIRATITLDKQTGDLSSVSNPMILIVYPPDFIYQDGKEFLCSISNDLQSYMPTTCTPTLQSSSSGIGNYISRMTISLPCKKIQCTQESVIGIQVFGNSLRNPYNVKSLVGNQVTFLTTYLQGQTTIVRNSNFITIGNPINGVNGVNSQVRDKIIVNSITRVSTNVDINTQIIFDLEIPTKFPKNSLIQVAIPYAQFLLTGESFSYQPKIGQLFSNAQTPFFTQKNSTHVVLQLVEWCSGKALYCKPGQNIIFKILTGFKNLRFIFSSQPTYIFLSLFDNNNLLVDGLYTQDTLIATPNLDISSISIQQVNLSSNYVGATNISMDIYFSFNSLIDRTDVLVFSFTDQYIRNDFQKLTACYDYSFDIPVSKQCTFNTSKNIIQSFTIQNFCGTQGTQCITNQVYRLRITGLVNILESVSYFTQVTLTAYTSSNQNISQGTYITKPSILQTVPLSNLTVVRSSNLTGQPATFTFNLSIPSGYVLQVGAYIQAFLPFNQMTLAGVNPYVLQYGGVSTQTYQIISSSTTSNTISFLNTQCTQSNCVGPLNYSFIITNVNNPDTVVQTPTSFNIVIKSANGNSMFQSTSSLFATPLLIYGYISQFTISNQNQSMVNSSTSYTFSFNVSFNIPQLSTIQLTFPENRVYKDSTSVMSCIINGVKVITITNWLGSSDSPQLQLVFNQYCPTSKSCQAGNYKFVCTGGIKNPPSVSTINSNFTLQIINQYSELLTSASLPNNQVNQIIPQVIAPLITYQPYIMKSGNIFNISFVSVNKILNDGFIRIIVPLFVSVMPYYQPTCQNGFTLQYLNCEMQYANLNEMWIDLNNEFCNSQDCPQKSQISIMLYTPYYPYLIEPLISTSWQIYTLNSNKEKVDGISENLRSIDKNFVCVI